MASGNSERLELAKFCSSRNWSKAIRILDSLLARSSTIQDLCNRAFCYGQLELHKHVIKDCDRALELDPGLLQAYILKGHAYSALGRKDDALLVWKHGYELALNQSSDLKQLLELEELLPKENANGNINQEKHTTVSSAPVPVSEGHSTSEAETAKDPDKLRSNSEISSEFHHMSEVQRKFVHESHVHNGSVEKVKETKKFERKQNGTYKKLSSELESLNKPSAAVQISEGHSTSETETAKDLDKLSNNSGTSSESNYMSEVQSKLVHESHAHNGSVEKVKGTKKFESKPNGTYKKLSSELESLNKPSEEQRNKSNTSKVSIKLNSKNSEEIEWSDAVKKNHKVCVARVSKTKSISLDLRLSRGIAEIEGINRSAVETVPTQ